MGTRKVSDQIGCIQLGSSIKLIESETWKTLNNLLSADKFVPYVLELELFLKIFSVNKLTFRTEFYTTSENYILF